MYFQVTPEGEEEDKSVAALAVKPANSTVTKPSLIVFEKKLVTDAPERTHCVHNRGGGKCN